MSATSAVPAERTAADLKQRLELARRKQTALERSRDNEVSGVRPIGPLEATAPSEPAAPNLVLGNASTARRAWRPLVRGLGLVVFGVVSGVVAARWAWPVNRANQPVVATPAAQPVGRVDTDSLDVPFTNIATQPPGAEIVLRGAVVANTPARVPRPAYEALYLLRRSGYHPQLVRVSPQTGDSIVVTLRPLVEEQLEPAAVGVGPKAKHQPDPVGKSRGNDVGRQSAPKRSDGLVVGSRPR